MRIYVDFDDCLCETAKSFSHLVKKMFDKNVPYEEIRFFNLQDSFSLTEEQYEQFMIKGHEPETLLSLAETAGAVQTVNEWLDKGYDVSVITGRPFSAYDASREWLNAHDLKRVRLYCLNKYGRDSFIKNSLFNLELNDYYQMHFDYAVEDSALAFSFFNHLPDLKVMVMDRPWNQDCHFPNGNYRRCYDWKAIRELVK